MLHRIRHVLVTEGFRSLFLKGTTFLVKNFRLKLESSIFYRLRWYTQLVLWWNTGRGRYSAVADPLSEIYVDPNDIRRVTGRGPFPGRFVRQDIGKIRAGDWDRNMDLFTDIGRVKAIQERIREESAWKEIEFVTDEISRIESGHSETEWETISDLRDWCDTVDDLQDSVNKSGYLSKKRVDEIAGDEPPGRSKTPIPLRDVKLNVTVDIGRDGDLLFVNGRHRLAVAQALEVEQIPVNVVVRHREWQQKREDVHASRGSSECSFHPDLRDIVM